jgi:hypothetical protein
MSMMTKHSPTTHAIVVFVLVVVLVAIFSKMNFEITSLRARLHLNFSKYPSGSTGQAQSDLAHRHAQ